MSRSMRDVVVILIVAAMFSMMVVAVAWDIATPDQPAIYPPCPTEDSVGPCYWDADEHGNGRGRSFLVHEDGTVEYTR